MTFRRTGPLTSAQLAALRTVASGYTSEQAAVILGCARASVDTRIRDAIHTLDAESRTHAVAICLALGLIVPRDIHVPETTRQRTRGAAA